MIGVGEPSHPGRKPRYLILSENLTAPAGLQMTAGAVVFYETFAECFRRVCRLDRSATVAGILRTLFIQALLIDDTVAHS